MPAKRLQRADQLRRFVDVACSHLISGKAFPFHELVDRATTLRIGGNRLRNLSKPALPQEAKRAKFCSQPVARVVVVAIIELHGVRPGLWCLDSEHAAVSTAANPFEGGDLAFQQFCRHGPDYFRVGFSLWRRRHNSESGPSRSRL